MLDVIMLSIFHIYLMTAVDVTKRCDCDVGCNRNVRCDNVVNISHLFDDMLLMSQNDLIMTWAATSWNVRCDNVVNISHLFDDMLLMSQIDGIMTWVATSRNVRCDDVVNVSHLFRAMLLNKTMWLWRGLQHPEMLHVIMLSIFHIYLMTCCWCENTM